jgi:hypothetical protein
MARVSVCFDCKRHLSSDIEKLIGSISPPLLFAFLGIVTTHGNQVSRRSASIDVYPHGIDLRPVGLVRVV